jgi:hypothetical protein
MAALQEQESIEPRETLPPTKPSQFTDIYWLSFIHMGLSEEEALTQKEWATRAFPNEKSLLAYSRIGNVLNGRLEKLCQTMNTRLHITVDQEVSQMRRYWRDPIGTSPVATYEIPTETPVETPTETPTPIRKTYSDDPGADFRTLKAVIHVGENFRGLAPESEDEFLKRYPYERRVRLPGRRFNSSFS